MNIDDQRTTDLIFGKIQTNAREQFFGWGAKIGKNNQDN